MENALGKLTSMKSTSSAGPSLNRIKLSLRRSDARTESSLAPSGESSIRGQSLLDPYSITLLFTGEKFTHCFIVDDAFERFTSGTANKSPRSVLEMPWHSPENAMEKRTLVFNWLMLHERMLRMELIFSRAVCLLNSFACDFESWLERTTTLFVASLSGGLSLAEGYHAPQARPPRPLSFPPPVF